MKTGFALINQSYVILVIIFSLFVFSSCGSSSTDETENSIKKDTTITDQAEMIEIEEVEMESIYEVTNTKTHKTVTMTQTEYLESAIWENPDYIIKEIPTVK